MQASKRTQVGEQSALFERLNSFAELAPGWDGDKAPAIPSAVVERAQNLVILAEEYALRLPFAAPAGDETILLEWQLSDATVECYVGKSDNAESFVVTRDGRPEDVAMNSWNDLKVCLQEMGKLIPSPAAGRGLAKREERSDLG